MKQEDKQTIVKIVLSIAASTALGTVLLLVFPTIAMFIFFLVVIPSSFLFRFNLNNSPHLPIIAVYILGGIFVFISGAILNGFLMRKCSRPYRIISIILYAFLIALIAILMSEHIFYQMNHISIKV